MRQRAMIAMALALEPKLIIADEPTTALDATVQAQILDLLLRLQQDLGTALIMITHDLGVIADIADDVMVMYAGRAAEKAPKRDIFYAAHHPYTKGLLESIPSSKAAGGRLKPIPGSPPSLINLPSGCKFHPRCGYVFDHCLTEEPVLHPVAESGDAHLGLLAARRPRPGCRPRPSSCASRWSRPSAARRRPRWSPRPFAGLGAEPDSAGDPAAAGDRRAGQRGERGLMAATRPAPADDNVLVRVENVVKYFPVKAGGFIQPHRRPGARGRRRVADHRARARPSAWSARPAAASPPWPAASPG